MKSIVFYSDIFPLWKTTYSKSQEMVVLLSQKYVMENMAIIKDRLLLNILENHYHYVFRINKLNIVATTSDKHQQYRRSKSLNKISLQKSQENSTRSFQYISCFL